MKHVNSIRFDPNQAAAGEGEVASQVWYRDPTGEVRAGYWTAAGGSALDLVDHASEFCILLEGSIRLTGVAGNVEIYRQGESFVIPAGFNGRWETLETCRKFFVIHQMPANGDALSNGE